VTVSRSSLDFQHFSEEKAQALTDYLGGAITCDDIH
jgi:hypothetical protein